MHPLGGGSTPDDIVRRIRQDVGPGRAIYSWGGMAWSFHIVTDGVWTPVNYGDWVVVDPAAGTVRVVNSASDENLE